jgi:ABC-type uncharacterized transport system substrate-binding protein
MNVGIEENMMQIKKVFRHAAVIMICVCAVLPATVQAAKFKVLVVMSYEKNNPWCLEIKEGIESALEDTSEITYIYMDTKINLEGGMQKAKEAYALYRKLQPDGVITADDNAQWLFVLPYLKDKVDTPVMFCGVNADAQNYGYPASNVSGILERAHIGESIAFVKQLVPSIKTVGFLAKYSPSGKALLQQVENESDTYPAKFITFKLPSTLKELVTAGEELKESSDVLFIESLEGIPDEAGHPLDMKEIMRITTTIFEKPIIGANQYHIKQGALCAVIKTGQEQGRTAAQMLLKAMRGTPVSEIPVTRNYKGRRVINVTVMEALGIEPKPIVLIGAKLVRTEK